MASLGSTVGFFQPKKSDFLNKKVSGSIERNCYRRDGCTSATLSPSSFIGFSVQQHSTSSKMSDFRKRIFVCKAESKSVLIVNTNSGGHAVIGFWLAKQLRAWPRGHSVTVLTVGQESDSKMKKPPFNQFDDLRLEGVKTVWGSPSNVAAAVEGATFDVVLDNNGKDLESVKPVIDWAKAAGTKQFLFMSSAGIYKSTSEPPHVEGDAVKADAGHVAVEGYLSSVFGSSWAAFRPQYITGAFQNKDCEEWFFDRIVRNRPIPIPAPGLQLTVVAPVYDMASMLVAAIEQPKAAGGHIFNCVSDRVVTFDGLARMCAKAAGLPANVVHYSPSQLGVDVKKAFPFRNQHFYSEPRAAKEKLGWQPAHDLQEVLNARFSDYVASGRDREPKAFDLDDKILSALK